MSLLPDLATPSRGAPSERFAAWGWLAFGATAAAAGAALVLTPNAAATGLVALAGLAAALGVVAGTRLHLPHGRQPWLAWQAEPWVRVAAGIVVLVVADVGGAAPGAPVDPAPAWAVLRIVAFALVGSAGLTLLQERARGAGSDVLYEAAIAAALLGAVAWILGADPVVARGDAVLTPALLSAAVPIAGLICCGILAKLEDAARNATSVFRAVLGGTALVVAADAVNAVALLSDAAAPRWAASLRVVGYGLIGAGALHPAMRAPVDPVSARPVVMRRQHVLALLTAIGVGPTALFVSAIGDRPARLLTVAASSAILSVLVVAYLLSLLRRHTATEYLALHDDLTGLPDRVLYRDRVSNALAHSDRTGSKVAVMYVDLDRFKTINDSLGHAAGNDVLDGVARRLKTALRAEDTIARIGGDEFTVLLPDIDDAEHVAAVAQKLLAAFGEPMKIAGRDLFVTGSIGVAVYPGDGDDADALMKNADAAMYRAKDAGRNTFRLYTADMNARAAERLGLESNLHTALEKGELEVYYQPKVSLRTHRIVGMEALVRWNHPQLGLVSPAEFIPLAEETGLIVELGAWALRTACQQTKAWLDAGFPRLTVAVNLSARQFQSAGVEAIVARALRASGLAPIQLELELTESLALQDPTLTRASLLDLKNMGVVCSIDDFGTGYSGLNYLTRFPIDKLKIDKSFVQNIGTSRDDSRLVAGVIALAHGLDMEVVAEGVETEAQLQFLQEHGCDTVQGYYFSAPVPADEFEHQLMIQSATTPRVARRSDASRDGDGDHAVVAAAAPGYLRTSSPSQSRKGSSPKRNRPH